MFMLMDSLAFFTQEAAVQQVVLSSLHQELSGRTALEANFNPTPQVTIKCKIYQKDALSPFLSRMLKYIWTGGYRLHFPFFYLILLKELQS